ncbi:MAG: hypothetical protein ACR2MK_03845 [Solirubrobacteraceae bacterium]
MFTVIVPRSDVPSNEVADALRQGLGSRYKVLPGTALNWNPVGDPRPDHPDTIVVGLGSTRLFRAQVRISQHAGETTLHVSPGGITLPLRLLNRLWIARTVRQVLRTAPGLR